MHKLFGASAVLFVLGACSPQPESEVNQAADLTPVVVAEANLTNSTGSASVVKQEAIDRDKIAAEQPPRSPAPAGAAPSYDVQAYCETVSDAVGGSYVIEKGCRDQELGAAAEL
ncbi:MAG TPA: hypothetical protein VFP12_10895 [Allosphingosinicella sp.]|nr:hypothetical protein [Allosphingosinicella sp.]